MVEFSVSQFPGRHEFGGVMTLATKTAAGRHWLLKDKWKHSSQKPWTYENSVHLTPSWQKLSRSGRMENSRVLSSGRCVPFSRAYWGQVLGHREIAHSGNMALDSTNLQKIHKRPPMCVWSSGFELQVPISQAYARPEGSAMCPLWKNSYQSNKQTKKQNKQAKKTKTNKQKTKPNKQKEQGCEKLPWKGDLLIKGSHKTSQVLVTATGQKPGMATSFTGQQFLFLSLFLTRNYSDNADLSLVGSMSKRVFFTKLPWADEKHSQSMEPLEEKFLHPNNPLCLM